MSLEDYITYRIERSQEAIEEAEALFRLGHYATTINRLYYACFYIVQGLLLQAGYSTKTHTGIKSLFNKHYVITHKVDESLAKFFNVMFQKRQESDYGDRPQFQVDEIHYFIQKAKIFVATIEKLIRRR